MEQVHQAPRRCSQSHCVLSLFSDIYGQKSPIPTLHGSVANWVINMHNCSLQNTIKALLINKPTLTQVIPMVSEVLCGMDLGAVNQVLVHLLHFSTGAEEEPGRRALGSCCSLPKLQQCIPCLTKIAKCCPAFCSAFLGDSHRHCRV